MNVRELLSSDSWASMKTRRALDWKACVEKPKSTKATGEGKLGQSRI